MLLKTNTNQRFALTLILNISYEFERIELTVSLHDFEKHTAQTKQFPADKFSDALRYYKQQEDMFL